jgi:hypothetical protein
MATRRVRERGRGRVPNTPFKGMPPMTFHWALLSKGSVTSQKHHRLVTKPLTEKSLGAFQIQMNYTDAIYCLERF